MATPTSAGATPTATSTPSAAPRPPIASPVSSPTADTVWLLRGYDTVNDPTGFIRAWLEDHGLLYFDQVTPGQSFMRVQAWRTTRAPRQHIPTTAQPVSAQFGDGIRLLGYDLTPASPQPGQPLRLALYWQRTGAIDRPYKVFTQLLATDGESSVSKTPSPPMAPFPLMPGNRTKLSNRALCFPFHRTCLPAITG